MRALSPRALRPRGERVGARDAFRLPAGHLRLARCHGGASDGYGLLDFESSRRALGLYAAVFAVGAAAWCPIVLDYAMVVVPALLAERHRMLRAAAEHPELRDRAAHELTEGE